MSNWHQRRKTEEVRKGKAAQGDSFKQMTNPETGLINDGSSHMWMLMAAWL